MRNVSPGLKLKRVDIRKIVNKHSVIVAKDYLN